MRGSAPLLVAGLEHTHRHEACDDGGKSRSDCKQNHAVSLPLFSKPGGLGKDIDDVGCAIRNVRDDRQQEQTEAEIE